MSGFRRDFVQDGEVRSVSGRQLSETRYALQLDGEACEVDAIRLPDGRVRFADRWRPWRTVACWYLWRHVD